MGWTEKGRIGAPRYVHTQNTPSTAWSVNHGLGFEPSITVLVGGDDVTDAVRVHHIDDNTASVSSGIPLSGKAICR